MTFTQGSKLPPSDERPDSVEPAAEDTNGFNWNGPATFWLFLGGAIIAAIVCGMLFT